VHLDYASVISREHQAVDIVGAISRTPSPQRYEILLGDFNSYPESTVYQFLAGQQSLHGQETVPWHDLARSWADRSGSTLPATLDFVRNPRWKTQPTLERPARFDWILLQDTYVLGAAPAEVTGAGIFADQPAPESQIVASDHYGVYAEISIVNIVGVRNPRPCVAPNPPERETPPGDGRRFVTAVE